MLGRKTPEVKIVEVEEVEKVKTVKARVRLR